MQNRNPESLNFIDDGGADLENDTTVDDEFPASKGFFTWLHLAGSYSTVWCKLVWKKNNL